VIRRLARLRHLRRAEDGATIVEFALVLAPFLVLVLGLCDLGFRIYLGAMLQGALTDAARQQTVGGVSATTINNFVQDRLATIVPFGPNQATLLITPNSYYDYTGIGTMEPLTTDANNNNILDINDCFTDYNGDGIRDVNQINNADAASLGGSDDIVYYTATLTFPSFVPMKMLIGQTQPTETVTATTMMKNQPYASQATPATVCRTS
jgi:Flp pilus assembly pilin Flp